MPKATNYGGPNPLECSACKEYRRLFYKGVRFERGEVMIGMHLPFYSCETCRTDETVIPKYIVEGMVEDQLSKFPEAGAYPIRLRGEGDRFKHFRVAFKYDARDYYYFPGLFRQQDDGYLTPVFFDRDLLLYYNNHPDYRVELTSFTSVTIYQGDDPLLFHGLGINRQGRLFTWLGDLAEELKGKSNRPHLLRFQASNVESDHDLVSDFYFNQIEANFTDSDNERKVFELKAKFDAAMQARFGRKVAKLDVGQLMGGYRAPVMNEKDQIFNAYIKLNSYLTETLQPAELSDILQAHGSTPKELKGLGSLKLLERICSEVLKQQNAAELISPLFVLYDLRVLAGHLSAGSFDQKYQSCKDRLKLPAAATHFEVYQRLIFELADSLGKMCGTLAPD